MVCIANYNDKQEIIGCTREDGVSGGLDFLTDCKALEFTVTYKTQLELDALAFKTIEDKNLESTKQAKIKSLDELIITHNTVAYDAHGRAIGNMSAVVGIANFKYNQLLAQDVLAADAYQWIYKDTKIWWKGADDKPHEVMIESVCEALELSMNGISKILGLT